MIKVNVKDGEEGTRQRLNISGGNLDYGSGGWMDNGVVGQMVEFS